MTGESKAGHAAVMAGHAAIATSCLAHWQCKFQVNSSLTIEA